MLNSMMWPSLLLFVCIWSSNLLSGINGKDTCTDYLGPQCQDPAVKDVVCKDAASAPQFCAKTCGLCEITTPLTSVTTPTTTPTITKLVTTPVTSSRPDTCSDASPQCADKVIRNVVCKDKVTALQLCAKSCGLCVSGPTTATAPLNNCFDDPTSHCDPKLSSFICADMHFSQFCRKMCGICGKNTTVLATTRLTEVPTVMKQTPTNPKSSSVTPATAKTTGAPTTQISTTIKAPLQTYVVTIPRITKPSTVSPCIDAPDANCNDPNLLPIICNHTVTAIQFCAKTCGMCGKNSTVLATTKVPTSMRQTPTNPNLSSVTPATATATAPQQAHSVTIPHITKPSTVSLCMDAPDSNCNDPNLLSIICKDNDTAVRFCAKTCGMCRMTMPISTDTVTTNVNPSTTPIATATTTKLSSTMMMTSTKQTCSDKPDINCKDPQVHGVVCLDSDTALMLCPETCGICSMMTSPTIDTCQDDPTGNCQNPDIKSIVCLDSDTALLCPKTCNVCDKQHISAPVVG